MLKGRELLEFVRGSYSYIRNCHIAKELVGPLRESSQLEGSKGGPLQNPTVDTLALLPPFLMGIACWRVSQIHCYYVCLHVASVGKRWSVCKMKVPIREIPISLLVMEVRLTSRVLSI